jgi:hypothetical protein
MSKKTSRKNFFVGSLKFIDEKIKGFGAGFKDPDPFSNFHGSGTLIFLV